MKDIPENQKGPDCADSVMIPGDEEACIMNPFPSKDYLTRQEALDVISRVSMQLYIDGSKRRR